MHQVAKVQTFIRIFVTVSLFLLILRRPERALTNLVNLTVIKSINNMIIGSNIIFIKDLASTNDHAALLLKRETPPEGTVIHTNYQSAGRGQKGNRWESEDNKNLLLSIILYPDMIPPESQFLLSMIISLGIFDFLKGFIPHCSIKWPNDIYVNDDKIGGILIENTIKGSSILSTVAGIGLNINQTNFPREIINPVSLKLITATEYDISQCLKQLLGKLDRKYKKLLKGQIAGIKKEYSSSLYRSGQWHNYRTSKGYLYGKIVSVSDPGCLQIEDQWANMHEFSFKEIEFMP